MGVWRIAITFEENGITYEREKRFEGLVGSTPNSRLRYDFFLPQYNMLIEFDGEQHFAPVRIKGRLSQDQAIDKYQRCVANDTKKTQYAHDHGYTLLRIRYDEDVKARLLENITR